MMSLSAVASFLGVWLLSSSLPGLGLFHIMGDLRSLGKLEMATKVAFKHNAIFIGLVEI